jgi:hypothetical protein
VSWWRLNSDDRDSKEKRARHEQAAAEQLSRVFHTVSSIGSTVLLIAATLALAKSIRAEPESDG